jgi:lipopolysaccharide/colanic/teichoic acid biosynthesis glycosyltransferase
METMAPTLSPAGPTKTSTGLRPESRVPVEVRTIAADRIRAIELTPHSDRADAPRVTVTPRARSEILNRCVSVTLALIGLIVLSPLFAVIALAIKLTSPGPICYRQIRVGVDRRRTASGGPALYDRRTCDLGGEVFRIYKFRSMRVDAERESGAVWATVNDPRVTPLGRFMRKTRIDELPQLINVVRGDMNIVGPRPERPSFFGRLRETIPEYPLRQMARPGITGWAQVNHRYDACVDDVRRKVQLDLEYLEQQGLAEDLRIMLRTIPVVLFGRGAC